MLVMIGKILEIKIKKMEEAQAVCQVAESCLNPVTNLLLWSKEFPSALFFCMLCCCSERQSEKRTTALFFFNWHFFFRPKDARPAVTLYPGQQ